MAIERYYQIEPMADYLGFDYDAVMVDWRGAWLGEVGEDGEVSIILDREGEYLHAPKGWQQRIVAELGQRNVIKCHHCQTPMLQEHGELVCYVCDHRRTLPYTAQLLMVGAEQLSLF